MRAKIGEETRLGCKYADRVYAVRLNISEDKAQEVYRCAVNGTKGLKECPFGFLPDCLEVLHKADNYKNGVVDGLLGDKVKTCNLIPIEYYSDTPLYECNNCQGITEGEIEFMKYCPKCGVRLA